MDADAAWHPGPSVQRTSGVGSTFQTGYRQESTRRKEQALKFISSLPLPASSQKLFIFPSFTFHCLLPITFLDISPSGLFNFRRITYLTSLFSAHISFIYWMFHLPIAQNYSINSRNPHETNYYPKKNFERVNTIGEVPPSQHLLPFPSLVPLKTIPSSLRSCTHVRMHTYMHTQTHNMLEQL